MEVEETVSDELDVSTPAEESDVTESVAASDEGESAEPESEDPDRPRDANGRFLPKSPQEEPQALAAPPTPVDTTEPQGKPFVVRSDRQEYTLDGAVLTDKGLLVETSQVQNVQQLISEGIYYRKNGRRMAQELEDLRKQAAPQDLIEREKRANALLAELDTVLADPEALGEFYNNLQAHGPALKERARARLLEQRLKEIEGKTNSEQAQQEQQQEYEEKVSAFQETVVALKSDQRFKLFTEVDWTEYVQEMEDLEPVLFVRQEDGLYLDEGRMLRAAEKRAALLNRAAQKAVGLNKATQFNQARGKTPAPVVPQAVEAPVTIEPPQTRDEWLARLERSV